MSDLTAKDVDGNEIRVGDEVFMVCSGYVRNDGRVDSFTHGRTYRINNITPALRLVVEDDDGTVRYIHHECFSLNDPRVRDFSGKLIEQPQQQEEEPQVPFQEESESMRQQQQEQQEQQEEKKYVYVDEWKDSKIVTGHELLEDIKTGVLELNSGVELYELGSKVEMNLSLNIKPLKD